MLSRLTFLEDAIRLLKSVLSREIDPDRRRVVRRLLRRQERELASLQQQTALDSPCAARHERQ